MGTESNASYYISWNAENPEKWEAFYGTSELTESEVTDLAAAVQEWAGANESWLLPDSEEMDVHELERAAHFIEVRAEPSFTSDKARFLVAAKEYDDLLEHVYPYDSKGTDRNGISSNLFGIAIDFEKRLIEARSQQRSSVAIENDTVKSTDDATKANSNSLLEGIKTAKTYPERLANINTRCPSEAELVESLISDTGLRAEFITIMPSVFGNASKAFQGLLDQETVNPEDFVIAQKLIGAYVKIHDSLELDCCDTQPISDYLLLHNRLSRLMLDDEFEGGELPDEEAYKDIEWAAIEATQSILEQLSIRETLYQFRQTANSMVREVAGNGIGTEENGDLETFASEIATRLTESERYILEALSELIDKNEPPITAPKITSQAGTPQQATRTTLAAMVRYGLLNNEGNRIGYSFTAVGILVWNAVHSKDDTTVGTD